MLLYQPDCINSTAPSLFHQVYFLELWPSTPFSETTLHVTNVGVALSGSYDVVPSHDLRNSQPITDGTVLIPTAGRGVECDINCTDAFIYCTENSLVRGLVILYDEQERVETPVPYPWAIFLGDPHKVYSGSADNAAVEDVELLGAWNGVAAVQAHRHYISRVMLCLISFGF